MPDSPRHYFLKYVCNFGNSQSLTTFTVQVALYSGADPESICVNWNKCVFMYSTLMLKNLTRQIKQKKNYNV